MAVAEYVTKVELDALEKRLLDAIAGLATKEYIRTEANRVIDAISHGTNPNY